MRSRLDDLLLRVRSLSPELTIDKATYNGDGLVNEVLIINDALIYRFARDENAAQTLRGELRILNLLQSTFARLVPVPIAQGEDYVIYPLKSGKPLIPNTFQLLTKPDQQSLIEQLGAFLYALHHTKDTKDLSKIPNTGAPVTRERWVDMRQRVRKTLYPLMLKHQVAWVEALFAGVLDAPDVFDYSPALIHADLASYHILYEEVPCRLTGVLDFGVAGLGDPASDLGMLIQQYGERSVLLMGSSYSGLDKLLPRARFYAQSIELEWVLLGLERDESFWFTAHIGGARDIG